MPRENSLSMARNERPWHWRDSQEDILTRFPKEPPTEPLVGAGWWDETHRCLCVWDGRQWVSVPLD